MRGSPFFAFFSLTLFAERRKHAGVVILSVLLIFLLSSSLFVSSSLQHSLSAALEAEPDFVVQRVRGAQLRPVPMSWADEIIRIHGVDKLSVRVWGRYFTRQKEESFLLLGIDFLEEQAHRALEQLIGSTDLRQFLKRDNMIVGDAVNRWLSSHYYEDSYRFLNPEGNFIDVKRFAVLPARSNLLTSDMVIVSADLARKILGLGEEEATDITFNVPNDDEWDNVSSKVSALHYDLRVIDKRESRKAYARLFDYKSGFFLTLFLIALLAFVLILYQRFSQVYSGERRYIGILRALGWSIRDVLKLKFFETVAIILTAFITGVVAAYFYVFAWDAPLLRQIFLGSSNLSNHLKLIPVLDFSVLATIFLLYAVPFVAAVLIPVWKIAVTDPKEAML
jgi:ABC-type lipoprotein release transport system permease subunit